MQIGLGIGIPFRRNAILAAFTPASLFSAGEQGAWYDPSDRATMFQDAAGTTPVTAVEQPVGLILDKSKGLVLGPELVTNGDFSNGTTGWTAFRSTLSVVSGRLRVTEDGVNTACYGRQSFSVVSGRSYKVTIDISNINASKAQVWIGSAYGSANWLVVDKITTARTVSATIVATTNTLFLEVLISATAGGTTEYADFDNISVRELPGNHAFQTTATSRPRLSARYNLLNNTDVLSTQSITVRNVKHILSFSGTGSVALSGAFTGTLAGTGANNRVYLEFTPTAGSLTLTVSGSVEKAQLEEV